MESLINIVRDWPILLQGAIGSALFWIILTAIQKIYEITETYISHRSLKQRKSWLINNIIRLKALVSQEHSVRGYYSSMLLYRSFRHLFKGIMWLSLGLIFNSLLSPTGIVGYIGCIYYMLKAFEVVKPVDTEKLEKEAELEKLQDELKLVKEKLKSQK